MDGRLLGAETAGVFFFGDLFKRGWFAFFSVFSVFLPVVWWLVWLVCKANIRPDQVDFRFATFSLGKGNYD